MVVVDVCGGWVCWCMGVMAIGVMVGVIIGSNGLV